MKKIILLVAVGLLFTGAAKAQNSPNFQFGIKGGGNISNFSDDDDYKNKIEFGYLGGVWARFGETLFNFEPEAYYTSKAVNVTYGTGSRAVFNSARFNSIDIPLLVGTGMDAETFTVRFYTGPDLSFTVNSNQNFGTSSDVKLNYKNQNYAWQYGVAIDMQNLTVDLRYEAGLDKIFYGSEDSAHTRVNILNLTLAYRLAAIKF